MDEIYNLSQYFPLSISDSTIEKYVDHHFLSYSKCVENGLYSSAYSHLHILYMTFIYIQLFRISKNQEKEKEFNCFLQDFKTKNGERDLKKELKHPFELSFVNEKSIFDFFYILGFEYKFVKEISEVVKKRNDHLHANGKIFFETSEDLEKEIVVYTNNIKTIIKKQIDFLKGIYKSIIENYEQDFEMNMDEIETNFANPYYFSEYELKLLAKGKKDVVSEFINKI